MSAFSAGRAAVMDGFDDDTAVVTDDAEVAPEKEAKPAAAKPANEKPKANQKKPGKGNGAVDDPRTGSLTTIAETIPSEGLAFFLAFYGLFLSTLDSTQDWAKPLLALAIVAGAIVVNAVFVLGAGFPEYRAKRGKSKKAAGRRLLLRIVLFSALCVIYIGATPLNPFIFVWDWPLLPGTVIAALAAFVIVKWGQVRDLFAGKPKKP